MFIVFFLLFDKVNGIIGVTATRLSKTIIVPQRVSNEDEIEA